VPGTKAGGHLAEDMLKRSPTDTHSDLGLFAYFRTVLIIVSINRCPATPENSKVMTKHEILKALKDHFGSKGNKDDIRGWISGYCL
jgi:hypothetical protein